MRVRILSPILLLALVACSTSAESGAAAPDEAADALAVNLMDFMIMPSELEATGPTVTIEVTSDGPTPHNLTVRDEAGEVVMATKDLSAGDRDSITAELEPGDYTILCSLAGHESLGMSGTLTVTST